MTAHAICASPFVSETGKGKWGFFRIPFLLPIHLPLAVSQFKKRPSGSALSGVLILAQEPTRADILRPWACLSRWGLLTALGSRVGRRSDPGRQPDARTRAQALTSRPARTAGIQEQHKERTIDEQHYRYEIVQVCRSPDASGFIGHGLRVPTYAGRPQGVVRINDLLTQITAVFVTIGATSNGSGTRTKTTGNYRG